MAEYRALRKHWINERIVDEGEVVEYAGEPGRWLEPLDGESKKAKTESDKKRKDRAIANAKGEPYIDEDNVVVDFDPRPRGPQLIKSHPIMPNLEGSSGEHTGESPIASPEAKARLAKQFAGVAERRAAAGRSKPGKVEEKAKEKGTDADKQPRRKQSDPIASPDQQ